MSRAWICQPGQLHLCRPHHELTGSNQKWMHSQPRRAAALVCWMKYKAFFPLYVLYVVSALLPAAHPGAVMPPGLGKIEANPYFVVGRRTSGPLRGKGSAGATSHAAILLQVPQWDAGHQRSIHVRAACYCARLASCADGGTPRIHPEPRAGGIIPARTGEIGGRARRTAGFVSCHESAPREKPHNGSMLGTPDNEGPTVQAPPRSAGAV